jgi:hypothetical protein
MGEVVGTLEALATTTETRELIAGAYGPLVRALDEPGMILLTEESVR